MPDGGKRYKFWAGLGLLVFLLVNYPLLHIVNREALWAGVPVLFLFLHAVWLGAIVGLYMLSRRLTKRD